MIEQQPECCLWLCSEFERRQYGLDIQNILGNSLVHLAAIHNSQECLQIVVASGANIYLVNKNNKTAAEIAHQKNYKVILGKGYF